VSRGEHLYQIIVRCSNHAQVPRARVLSRDSERAGVDAAIRELRRVRNTARDGSDFDTWDLYSYDQGNAKRRLLRSGNVNGWSTPVQNDRRDQDGASHRRGSAS
jgi:hypothetical protein